MRSFRSLACKQHTQSHVRCTCHSHHIRVLLLHKLLRASAKHLPQGVLRQHASHCPSQNLRRVLLMNLGGCALLQPAGVAVQMNRSCQNARSLQVTGDGAVQPLCTTWPAEPPGSAYPVCHLYSLLFHLRPVNSACRALTTITTSPLFSWGAKVGLSFPCRTRPIAECCTMVLSHTSMLTS